VAIGVMIWGCPALIFSALLATALIMITLIRITMG
jgi:hypothetical protein